MKKINDTRIIIGVLIIVIVLIQEFGKSVRIQQLKTFDDSTIESIGKYEKDSKIECIKVLQDRITD